MCDIHTRDPDWKTWQFSTRSRACSNLSSFYTIERREVQMHYQALYAHGGGRVVRVSGSKTTVSSSTSTSAIIYDAYTSLIKNKINNKKIAKILRDASSTNEV